MHWRNGMKRIAIVSSYNEECGAAFYSSRLKKHFEAAGFEVDVKRLPVSLLRIKSPSAIRRKGDAEIRRIASELPPYDAVFLQLEPGLYGTTARSSYRRIKLLLQASRQVVVTVHGFDRSYGGTSLLASLGAMARGEFMEGVRELRGYHLRNDLRAFWNYVRDAAHVKVLTFCMADQTLLKRYYDLPRVDHYPITYFDQAEVARIKASVDRDVFLRQHGMDPRKKYFAVCGFLSAYKGHLTAMKALEFRPEDWNVVILGGEHPHSIEAEKDIGRYLRQLLAFSVEKEDGGPMAVGASGLSGNLQMFDSNRKEIKDELFPLSEFKHFLPRKELRNRIKFLGQVSDEDMPKFYCALDYVVHPYIRTKSGQSGSGPATLALEFGAKSLFTNVPVFREMGEYFKNAMYFFNVGNFIELSEALERYDGFDPELTKHREVALKTYNPAGMVAKYRELMAL